MRTTWFWFLAFALSAAPLYGQVDSDKATPSVKGFSLVQRTLKAAPPGNTAQVLDHRGRIVGQFSAEMSRTEPQYAFRFDNGKSATVPALSHVLYNAEADRLLVYGASVRSHVVADAQVLLYTGNGTLVKDLGLVAYIPFEMGMAGNGDLYVAGKTVYEQPVFELKKYDAQGTLLWAKNLPFGTPTELAVAESGQRIGLAMYDQETQKTMLYYFDDAGNTLAYNNDFGMIANLEFLGDDKVVVCTGRQFYLYRIAGQVLVNYAQYPGNAIGKRPITPTAAGDGFVVTSVADPVAGSGYRVQAYDAEGKLVRETVLPGVPTAQAARLTVFRSADEFSLQTPQEAVMLKIDR